MIVSKQKKTIEQKRAEMLNEIATFQSMTKHSDIKHGLNWMKLGLLKRWGEKRKNKSTPEQVAKNFQAAQQRTAHGKNRNTRWNAEDVRVVFDAEVSDEEIALMLGRTTQAIRRKRANIIALGNGVVESRDSARIGQTGSAHAKPENSDMDFVCHDIAPSPNV